MQAAPSQRAAPDIPEAVTTLLDAVRRLEDTLRLWGAQQTTEEVASDAFVIVGNCFYEMLTAFASYDIDTEYVSLVPHSFLVSRLADIKAPSF